MRTRLRRAAAFGVFATLIGSVSGLLTPAVLLADPGDVGFSGPAAVVSGTSALTGSKPESKLWYNDGFWWADMWDENAADFFIWRLDRATQTWVRTDTRLDDRSGTRADVLWDGTHLYVASHTYSNSDGSGVTRLYRFSYNTSTDTYTLDGGFPATGINGVRSETLVIDKDSTGQLWATWEQGGSIWVNRSTTGDNTWGTPFVVPASNTVDADDISSLVAFGGDKIGLMWSDQTDQKDYFAVHLDSAADTTWQPIETAFSGTSVADDHVNLKTDSGGRLFAAVKTSLTGSNTLLALLERATNGTWANYRVTTGSEGGTRPIVVADELNDKLHVFYTTSESGGDIVQKESSMSSISFATPRAVVMHDQSDPMINNATSTKQNPSAQSGIVVAAFNDAAGVENYWHADIGASGATNTPPTANPASATTAANTPVSVSLSGSDAETCDLTFTITTPPAHGTLGSISNNACTAGSPNTDAATVTYTPTSGYSGPDSFQYRVSDVSLQSAPATATLNVTSGGLATLTFTPVADAQVNSASVGTNYGATTSLRTREDPSATTYRSYLRFNVSGVGGTVSSVKLRLFATDPSPNTQSVFPTATSWNEVNPGGITWSNVPATTGGSLGGAPTNAAGYNEITLATSAVPGDGVVSFLVRSNGTNSAIFDSREAANDPQLVVTFGGGPPPPPAPVADFGADRTTGQAPLTVAFSDSSTNSPTNWSWNFGDPDSGANNTSTLQNPTHTYNGPGTYTVSLTATNGGGSDTETKSGYITVSGPPTANFSGTPRSGNAPLTVAFTDASSGATATGWSWSFGDGGTSTERNPSHEYTATGQYTVSLTTTFSGGGSDTETKTNYITVNPPAPVADFSATPTSGNLPLNVQFTDSSTNNPTSWSWNFGDPGSGANNSSTSRNPSHTYNSAGTYTVSLTATNAGGSDTETKTGYITVTDPNPTPTTATFNATADSHVLETSPNTNYGTATSMRTRLGDASGTNPHYRSYVQFNVTGISGSVDSVKLRVFVTDASAAIQDVYVVAPFIESGAGGLTWANQPTLPATPAGSATVNATGFFDITLDPSSVPGNGTVSLAIDATMRADNLAMVTKEGNATQVAQLIVTY